MVFLVKKLRDYLNFMVIFIKKQVFHTIGALFLFLKIICLLELVK